MSFLSHLGNKIGELKFIQCPIKVKIQANPIKIQVKLLHLTPDIFSKLYRQLVTLLYTRLPSDIV